MEHGRLRTDSEICVASTEYSMNIYPKDIKVHLMCLTWEPEDYMHTLQFSGAKLGWF